jgi:hypothetical protein
MEAKTLRILTWKAVLGFGKYPSSTISQIYYEYHTAYLRWIYYNLNGISFNDDILYRIGVITDNRDSRINKPGVDNDLYKTVEAIYHKSMVAKGLNVELEVAFKLRSKRKLKDIEKEERKKYSKANLQWKNQGHRF